MGSEEVSKEQTKGAEHEKVTELSDKQLAEVQGGAIQFDLATDNYTDGSPNEGGRDPVRLSNDRAYQAICEEEAVK